MPHCEIWTDGKFSNCFEKQYLGISIPSISCLASLIIHILSYFYYGKHATLNGFKPVATTEDEDDGSSISTPVVYRTSHGPRATLLEASCLLADLAVSAALALHGPEAHHPASVAIVAFITSGYLLLLIVWRTGLVHSHSRLGAYLLWHSFSLYTVEWLCMSCIAYSTAIGQDDHFSRGLIFGRLAIFTCIVLLFLTAPKHAMGAAYQAGASGALSPAREQSASILSALTFYWVSDTVWKAFQTTLEATDLLSLNQDQKCSTATATFRTASSPSTALLWRLLYYSKTALLAQGAWAAVMSLTIFIPALLLQSIILYLQSPDTLAHSTAWLCVFGLFLAGLVTGIADCQCEWIGRKASAKVRSILTDEIYRKSLQRRWVTVSKDQKTGGDGDLQASTYSSAGHILTLMAVDTEQISEVAAYMHLLWISVPLQLLIATTMLYRLLGFSGVTGLLLMILMLPANVWLAKHQGEAQGAVLAAMDSRVQSSNEVLTNIRTIKYCAWEIGFAERILGLRRIELGKLRLKFIWWSIGMTIWYSIPYLITIVTLLLYTVVQGKSLETSLAFPALAVFQILRLPLDRVADMISFALQAYVSVNRVSRFLDENETEKYAQLFLDADFGIGFERASFKWYADTSDANDDDLLSPGTSFQLTELQIEFPQSSLSLICGPSGSGKSSMLLALLGEMELISGQVFLPHDVSACHEQIRSSAGLSNTTAYCPQEPWILNQSLKSNILFGLPFDRYRYNAVIEAVTLAKDLVTLDNGDETLAGESGCRLSGGQKQRVALARALYSRARCLLLDDCLSAVDSHTATHIMSKAIRGPMMDGRTCILATHHVELAAPYSSFVVFLENGQVKAQGTPEELASAGMLNTAREKGSSKAFSDIERIENTSVSNESGVRTQLDESEAAIENNSAYGEEKFTGAVSWKVIRSYLTSMGSPEFWAVVLLAFAAQQLISLATNLWIKEWAHQYDELMHRLTSVNAGYYLGVYICIYVLFVLATFLRDILVFYGALRASSKIHELLLVKILHAKLDFFDRTPIGQIINRVSKDLGSMDQELASYSMNTLYMLSTVATIVVFISVVIPAFLFVAVVICLIYYCIGAIYINSSRDLKRIESLERSPLYQHFTETLAGFVSIRAYNCGRVFKSKAHTLIDTYTRPHILLWAGKEWLTLRISATSSMISALTGAFVLWKIGSIDSGLAGLVLTYAASFSENILWFVQLYAIIQQSFSSVERVLEYTETEQEQCHVPQQSSSSPRDLLLSTPANWPASGSVQFDGYSAAYAINLDPVLNRISLNIFSGARVAIVGRTGAGKSSLALSLIRCIEKVHGRILIDGEDIANIPLSSLRQAIGIVPQDPSLFAGSWRDNLDPLGHFSDAEIHAALYRVQLSPPTSGLDSPLEGASRGHRQLLCIARALVRKPKILILDEATANVDHEIDALIQPALKSIAESLGTTVITIAHRLRTIADYDTVVVLDAGRILEEGRPIELLDVTNAGPFRKMCEESGDLRWIEQAAKEQAR